MAERVTGPFQAFYPVHKGREVQGFDIGRRGILT